jgi:hypothetical protein
MEQRIYFSFLLRSYLTKTNPDFYFHYRAENATLFVAFAIGIYSVLRLFEIDRHWIEWWIYTAAYWVLQLLAGYTVLNWIFTTKVVDELHKENNTPEDFDKFQGWAKQIPGMHFLYTRLWENFHKTPIKVVAPILVWGGLMLSSFLYFVVAFPEEACILSELIQKNWTQCPEG